MEKAVRWFWFAGLCLAAWEDVRRREISARILGLWLVPGLVYVCFSGWTEHVKAAAVGAGLLLLAKATRGAVGEGDGLFFLVTACYLGWSETVALFMAALGVSCLWSSALMLRGFWTGKGTAGMTVPFLACAWLPGLWVACGG